MSFIVLATSFADQLMGYYKSQPKRSFLIMSVSLRSMNLDSRIMPASVIFLRASSHDLIMLVIYFCYSGLGLSLVACNPFLTLKRK
jgi:hypothetical protein